MVNTRQYQPVSSLQAQLAKVRDPAINRLKVSHDRYKDSFIFSAKEAADQDIATIYAIGKEGFTSLCQLSPEFKKFETALFSEATKNIDRVLLTEEENSELNIVIERFLVHLSPYFLISSAGKGLEWLVRRFRINEFNVDSILSCIFPYHESPLFLKMLSILHLRPETQWSPLISVRKSKLGLSQTQLVRWMVRDTSLLSFIVKLAKTGSKQTPNFSSLFSFYSSVLLVYLQEIPSLEDKELGILLPVTLKGLKSSCEDFKLSCFMIFLLVSSRVSLTKDITDMFIKRVTSGRFNFNVALTSLIRVSHSQTQNFLTDSVDVTIATWFISQDNAVPLLTSFSENHNTFIFVRYLLWALITLYLSSDSSDLALSVAMQLAEQPLLTTSSIVAEFCPHLFKLIAANSFSKASDLGKFFPILERQESELVQSLISQELQNIGRLEGKDSPKYLAFYSILVGQLQDSLSVPLKETNTTLSLSLIHPDTRFQLAAINKLCELLETHDPHTYSGFFPNLLNFLRSSNRELIEATLKLFSSHSSLVKAIPSVQLWEAVKTLPQDLLNIGFQLSLTEDFIGSNLSDCFTTLAENLILTPNNATTHSFVCDLLLKANVTNSTFLPSHYLSEKPDSSFGLATAVKRNLLYINMVSDNIAKSENGFLELKTACSLCSSIPSSSTQLIFVLLLSLAIQKVIVKTGSNNVVEIFSSFGEVLKAVLSSVSSGDIKKSLSIEAGIQLITSSTPDELNEASLVTVSIALDLFLMSVDNDITFKAWFSGSQTHTDFGAVTILETTFDILCSKSLDSSSVISCRLLSKYLKTNSIGFFCHISISDFISLETRARALILMSAYISNVSMVDSSIQDHQIILPYIFRALSHECELLRLGGLVCLESLDSVYSKSPSPGRFNIDGKEVFYGDRKSIRELPSNAAACLVKFVLQRQPEIRMSPSNFQEVFLSSLEVFFTGSSKSRDSNKLYNPLISFILSHISAMKCVNLQVYLLQMISSIDDKVKLRSLSQFFSQCLQDVSKLASDPGCVELFRLLFDLFTPSALGALDAKNPRYIQMILYAIGVHEFLNSNTTVSMLALEKLDAGNYESLSLSSQTLVIKALISIGTSDTDNLATIAKKVLLQLPLKSEPLNEMVQDLLALFVLPVLPALPAKKLKNLQNVQNHDGDNTSSQLGPLAELMQPLSQLTLLLEALDAHSDYSSFIPLSTSLFGFLTQLEEVAIRPTTTATNYVYQLLMSVLTGIFTSAHSKSVQINEATTKIDLVVQLLQLPAQPQTHHQALRLISSIATIIPQKVLGFIMPIFTFMGSNVLKKDDNYSFFIIQETLEKIIPPLLASYRQEGMDDESAQYQTVLHSKPLISVFVNALLKIPQHRRVKLFVILVKTLGHDFLYGVLGVILEIYATHHAQGNRDDASKFKEFCVEITGQFQPLVQIQALKNLLDTILVLPNEKLKSIDPSHPAFHNLYAFSDHSEKHLRHYKFVVINLVREALGRKSFLHQLLEIEANSLDAKCLDDNYILLAERLLLLADLFREHLTVLSHRDQVGSITKFFTQLVSFVYDVLNDVVNLCSLPCFTLFLKKLLLHQRSTIRFRSIQLLESKLDAYHSQMAADEVQAFLCLVPTLSNLVQKDSEVVLNRQNALNCIGVYLQCFSSHHGISEDKLFIENIVPLLLGEYGLRSPVWPIYASSCHVASYICQELSLSFVKFIPQFTPLFLGQIENSYSIDNETVASTVWLSELVLLESLLCKLAKFTSPYLPQIITQLITFKSKLAERSNDLSLTARINSLVDMLHSKLEPRVILPILFKLYGTVTTTDRKAIEIFFEILSNVVISLSQEDVEKLYILLFKFYMDCFDFRQKNISFSTEEMEIVEDIILQSFILLVLKLRDDMFKPIFLKLSEWATQKNIHLPVAKNRMIVFYHLVDMMLSKLKHIFAPYFIYTIDNCMATLNSYENTSQCDQLWKYLLRSLAFSLQYDSEGIWTSETTGKLLPILLNQMHVVHDLALANEWLVPCFDWLCSAMTSESSWKILNHQVALKTRDESSVIKCIALCVIRTFYLRQKENFLSLLPETIPFLAEVMEDVTEDVVKCTRDLILTIERFNGESLDQYFR